MAGGEVKGLALLPRGGGCVREGPERRAARSCPQAAAPAPFSGPSSLLWRSAGRGGAGCC